MFDIQKIRENPKAFDEALAIRGEAAQAQKILELDEKKRAHQTQLQILQEKRNKAAKQIGEAKQNKDENKAKQAIEEVAKLKQQAQEGEELLRKLNNELENSMCAIPNLALADVPKGKDESQNKLVRENGEKPNFNFQPKQHFELNENMNFTSAAKISGSRFVVLQGALAKLERALGQFMLELHTGEHGYTEISPPLLVNDSSLFGTGQLPKFSQDLFCTKDGKWLIPTAEVPLTNLVRQQIVPQEKLPLRYTALTPCFRSEAGAAGKDTRGMLRQHQFMKVELVSIVAKENGEAELERMLKCAQKVLQLLELPYRTVVLCTGDMGFSARKTYDIEVWLPGQNAYREISSCSYCGDFQARRMGARYKTQVGNEFCHTLNGSGIALGRALIAVMENYQNEDGTINVPNVLQKYIGAKKIGAEK